MSGTRLTSSILNFLVRLPFIVIAVALIYLNIRLYSTQDYNDSKGYDEDVYAQLQHLKVELHEKNARLKMQQLFPEGFVFVNVFYGLAWSDLISEHRDKAIVDEALNEVDWIIDELHSENGTYIFQEELPVPYGVFYKG